MNKTNEMVYVLEKAKSLLDLLVEIRQEHLEQGGMNKKAIVEQWQPLIDTAEKIVKEATELYALIATHQQLSAMREFEYTREVLVCMNKEIEDFIKEAKGMTIAEQKEALRKKSGGIF